jgi:hypothetical protein
VQVTVVVPNGKVEPDGGTQVTVGLGQLSVTVAVKVTVAPAALVAAVVMFAGQKIAGGIASTTVTVVVQVVELPASSVAVIMTVCVPGPNMTGSGGLLLKTMLTGFVQLSNAAAGMKFKLALQFSLTGKVTSEHWRFGGSVSLTVIVNVQTGAPDGKEQVTAVVPTLKNEPEAGVHVTPAQSPVGGG